MENQLRIAGQNHSSLIDAPGISHVIYFAGCHKRCVDCHSPQLQSLLAGRETYIEDIEQDIIDNKLSTHVVFQGGEPLLHLWAVEALSYAAKLEGKFVWLYTGYSLEELQERLCSWDLSNVDCIVAGPYEPQNKNENYKYLASSNQKLLRNIGGIWYNVLEEEIDMFEVLETERRVKIGKHEEDY